MVKDSSNFRLIQKWKIKHAKGMISNNHPVQLFHDGDRYHVETSPLICGANQWTGFYMVTAYMKEFKFMLVGGLKCVIFL